MDSNNWRQEQVPIHGQVIGSDAVATAATEGGDWSTGFPLDLLMFFRQLNLDSNNWRQEEVPIQGQVIGGDAVAAAGTEGGDWRTKLQPETRQRIVNKITEILNMHLRFSGQEGLQELKKIAVRLEEKIYTAATSQSEYLREISLKMLTMETKSQNPMTNSLQSNVK